MFQDTRSWRLRLFLPTSGMFDSIHTMHRTNRVCLCVAICLLLIIPSYATTKECDCHCSRHWFRHPAEPKFIEGQNSSVKQHNEESYCWNYPSPSNWLPFCSACRRSFSRFWTERPMNSLRERASDFGCARFSIEEFYCQRSCWTKLTPSWTFCRLMHLKLRTCSRSHCL